MTLEELKDHMLETMVIHDPNTALATAALITRVEEVVKEMREMNEHPFDILAAADKLEGKSG